MVTKEYWWAGEDSKALKNLRWAKPLSGQRSDLLAWLRAQEAALERSSTSTRESTRIDETDADTAEILSLEKHKRSR